MIKSQPKVLIHLFVRGPKRLHRQRIRRLANVHRYARKYAGCGSLCVGQTEADAIPYADWARR